MRPRSILVGVSLLAFYAIAYANGPHDTPEISKRPAASPRVTVATSADLATDSEARATSDATSAADAAQEQVASSGGNSFSSSSDVLALELPGHTGATGVDGCHISRGSLGAFGIGSGGKVKIDEACAAHVRCLETAAALKDLGFVDAAARVVLACAGVEVPADARELVAPNSTVEQPTVPVYVTPEQLERAFRSSGVRK